MSAQNALDVGRVQSVKQVTAILDACCRLTNMGFSAVARVTDEKWLTCASLDHVSFGLKPGDELPLHTTICDEIRQHREIVVFDDASQDDRYREHHTPRIYGLRSYISVPIIMPNGDFFGTLCSIDTLPKKINTVEIIGIFKMFAELIATQLAAQEVVEETERALVAERETARLREEFIAVVGHDLRNPIAALNAGVRMLERDVARPEIVTREMKKSLSRMNSIISNLMDLARGRLGGGIDATKQSDVPLNDVIDLVVNEIRAFSKQEIIVKSTVNQAVFFDPQRLGQLLSNLVGNAVAHGEEAAPVYVEADVADEQLSVKITNKGFPMSKEVLDSLFQPFRRGDGTTANGLGLGLYISTEIARGHGGALTVHTSDGSVTFTFTMPVGP